MKVIITTSDRYHHLLPIFFFLFEKYWLKESSEIINFELVGYKKPDKKYYDESYYGAFVSLGEQGDINEWSTDLRKYFEKQEDWFIYMMEDSFIKGPVDLNQINKFKSYPKLFSNIGRINLSKETIKQKHFKVEGSENLFENTQDANYRLSTQPSIWNKEFLLKYMTPGLTPWQFEKQESINDGWKILGLDRAVVPHNEGVTKKDIFKYDLNGINEDTINEMKKLGII